MSNSQNNKPFGSSQIAVQDLAGKNAIVTGASRGIGSAIALHLATRGASVLGTCSSPESLHHIDTLAQTVANLYSSSPHLAPKIVGLPANLLDEQTPQSLVDAVKREFGGKIHILINNAAYDELRPIGSLDVGYVQRCLIGNLQTLVMSLDLLIRDSMFAPNSRIVNVSTDQTRGVLAHHSFGLFVATKSAMESLTRTWAEVLGKHPDMSGTTVNSLMVGATNTDAFMKSTTEEQRELILGDLLSRQCVGSDLAVPEDIAEAAGLLVGDGARWITGSVVSVCGGAVKLL